MKDIFAFYHLPNSETYTSIRQTEGEVTTVNSIAELAERSGFIVVPFKTSKADPIVIIRPDYVEELCFPNVISSPSSDDEIRLIADKELYATDFNLFHQQLVLNNYKKLVLSRTADYVLSREKEPLNLFFKACKRYPNMFVAMISTPQTGLWLFATPELLLEKNDEEWRTMALAGTMKLNEHVAEQNLKDTHWSSKNVQEQDYVARYIEDTLKDKVINYKVEGPIVSQAAHLIHLKSNITFTLKPNHNVATILDILHPTPAVCGLPKEAAYRFINQEEHVDRHYYSGFLGLYNLDKQTRLFVSIRCMQMLKNKYRLYAGGGLLKESTLENEWQETEDKMQTMKNLLK